MIFYSLQGLLSKLDTDIRLRRKAVFLIGDLVECHFEASNKYAISLFSNRFFLKTVVDSVSSNDLDLQEKVFSFFRVHLFKNMFSW